MPLSMSEKQSAANIMRGEYHKARKKRRGEILSEFIKLTGYNRSYASRKLRLPKISPTPDKQKKGAYGGRGRRKTYGTNIINPLCKIWAGMDYACGKRIHAGMPDMIEAMIRFNEMNGGGGGEAGQLLRMSASTIGRLLRSERVRLNVKGRSTTKPGALLKSKIPVRLGSEWDGERPGFIEIDLVAHCGESTRGQYINTLDAIDIATGWCETKAVLNKAQKHVFAALKEIRELLPFPLLGIDSDNGSEFINDELLRWCTEEKLAFTRSRPYRKNDGCHAEQKNWPVVRQNTGYKRYETQTQLELLNKLYGLLRLHTNFSMPSVKLERKERDGARIVKSYSKPITPYRGVMASEQIDAKSKERLASLFVTLNPIELRRQIAGFQRLLCQPES